MARVRDVEIDEVPEEVRPVYRRFSEDYGPFLNQVKVFAHRPPALKHIMGLLLDLAVVPGDEMEDEVTDEVLRCAGARGDEDAIDADQPCGVDF